MTAFASPTLPFSAGAAKSVAHALVRGDLIQIENAGNITVNRAQTTVVGRSEIAGEGLSQRPGRPLAQVSDPFHLEVHRAIEVGPADLPALPAYVTRDHDRLLRHISEERQGTKINLHLIQALALVRDRDMTQGLQHALTTAQAFPTSAPRRRLLGEIVNSVPDRGRATPAAHHLRGLMST